ncbi:hypothetical protein BRC84_03380 [Halobacteriales archaeon QS_1_68_44]|nr:MAG: hypothetical protein BRC84_03380 [Halobacteriales archaeon QS_1_68_44]
MAMNRRNVLIGLGTVAAGGGAALGTGAFSQVEADRTADFTVTSDDSALLKLSGDGTYVTSKTPGPNGNNTIEVNAQGLNDDATTILGTVTITNNSSDGNRKWVHVGGGADGNAAIDFRADSDQDTTGDSANNVSDGDSIVGSSNNVKVGSSEALSVEIVIDTTTNDDPSKPSTVTFVANDTDQSS